MIGCLRTRVRKQPIIALYFESERVLKFYNLKARPLLKEHSNARRLVEQRQYLRQYLRYTVGKSLTSLITLHFVGLRSATLQFDSKLQKYIRMGITIFIIFIWGGTCIFGNHVLRLRSRVAVKLKFPTVHSVAISEFLKWQTLFYLQKFKYI